MSFIVMWFSTIHYSDTVITTIIYSHQNNYIYFICSNKKHQTRLVFVKIKMSILNVSKTLYKNTLGKK